MKRAISIVLTLVMLLAQCLMFTAQATTVTPHTHKWVNAGDDFPATCTEPGKVYEYCSVCQEWRERTTPAKGHHFPPDGWITTKEPTCTEPGQEKNYCTRVNFGRVCGYEWRRELPALGHDWGEWYVVKEAKPGDPGIEERKCNRCGITEQRPIYANADEPSVFLNAYIPSPQPTYGEGEKIPYVLELTNNSDMPLYLTWIYFYEPDGSNGYVPSSYNKELAAHDTLYIYDFTITVTKADLESSFAPDFTVRFTADVYKSESDAQTYTDAVENNGWVQVTAHIGELGEEGALTLTKTAITTPANGSYFVEGEPVQFLVTIENTGSVPLYDVEIVEYPSGWTGWEMDFYTLDKFDVLEPSDGDSYTVTYTIAGKDCEKGTYTNQVQATGYTQKDHDSEYDTDAYAEATVDAGYDEDIGDMELIVEKKLKGYDDPDDYPDYGEDEVISFTIDVSNSAPYPIYNVTIVDEDSSGNRVTLGEYEVFESGRKEHFEVSHTVTGEEALSGVYTNTVIGTWYSDEVHDDTDELNTETDDVTVNLWYEMGDMEIYITKTEVSAPANSIFYTEDETVKFLIEVWNCQAWPLYNVRVWDEPQGETSFDLAFYEEFGPHQTVSFTVTHTVTAEDCANGSFENVALVSWESPNDTPDEEDEISYPNWMDAGCMVDCGGGPGVYIYKEVISEAANKAFYTIGEEIQYKITFINNTQQTLTGFTMHDTNAPDDKLNPPGGYGDVVPGQTITLTYSYKVLHDDAAIIGEVINTAFGTWWDSDGEPQSVYSQTIITPCGLEPTLDVMLEKREVSISADPGGYAVGEYVMYEITITNNSEYPIYDVEIVDPIKGSNEDAVVDIIPVLEPGEFATYLYQYKVQPEDQIPGIVLNQASATFAPGGSVTAPAATEGDEQTYQTIYSNLVEVPVLQDVPPEYPDVQLIKKEESVPADGMYYHKGELVVYSLVFVNNNDYSLFNVKIYDPLYSDTNPVASFMEVGEHLSTAPVTFSYEVQDIDVIRTWISNQAFAEYYLEYGDEDWGVYSNVVTVLTDETEPPERVDIDYSFSKTVVSASTNPGYYVEGETVAYLITLVNNSDYPMSIMGTWDELYNPNASLYSGFLTGGSGICAPHDSFTVPFSYQVTKADVEAGSITNYADMEINVQDDRGNRYEFFAWDEVTVETGEGPGDRQYPAVVKYVTNMPLKGYYEKDEDIEYDIFVYNFTGRPFANAEGYDILLPETGFFVQNLGTINDSDVVKFHVIYKVTESDVSLKSVYNIAWVTMLDSRYDESVTIYSNEVIVPTDGTTPPTESKRTVCEYKITAAGEGAEEFMNVYCSEHENVHAAVVKLISEADTEAKLAMARDMGIKLWFRALDSEYDRLIDAAEGELKTALENDKIAFSAYITALKQRLEAAGASGEEVFEAVTDAINDRVCELCYTQGHAPEERTDIATEETPVISRRNSAACVFVFDDTESKYFTKSLSVCNNQQPLLTATDRLFSVAGEDEAMLKIAWDKAAAFWLGDLEGKYSALSKELDPMARHYLATEKAALTATFETARALYEAYYDGDGLLAAELRARLIRQSAMQLCAK